MTWKEYINKDANNINKIFVYAHIWQKHGEATLYVTPEYVVDIVNMISDGVIASNQGRLILNKLHENNKKFAKECYELVKNNNLLN